MKKLKSLFLVALLALGANLSAQETEATAGATGSGTSAGGAAAGTGGAAGAATIGGIATSTVVIGAVAVGVAAAIIANNDDDGLFCAADEIISNGACVCPGDEVKVNGICTPPTTTTTCDVISTVYGVDAQGELNADGSLCVIPANTIVDSLGSTVITTITYIPTVS